MEAEREAERRQLEAQKVREMERLQAELDQELQAERRKLQEETEAKRAALKKVTMSTFWLQLRTSSSGHCEVYEPCLEQKNVTPAVGGLKPRRVNGNAAWRSSRTHVSIKRCLCTG